MIESFGGVRKTFASGFITGTASITAAADASFTSASLYPLHGNACVAAIVAGTFTATMAFEALAADGATWYSVPAVPVLGGASVTSITAAGNYLISTHGAFGVRLRCSAFTSNTSMTIAFQGTSAGAVMLSLVGTGTGATSVQGAAADGATAAGNPVQVGGVDGSGNAQALLTDTSGRPQIVGAAADGAALAGNPVLLGASDGTNAATLRARQPTTDASTAAVNYLLTGSLLLAHNGGGSSTAIDRIRTANGASNTTGTGLLGVGALGFDGTNYQLARLGKTDGSALGTTGVLAGAMHGWDGTGYSAVKVESSTNPNVRSALYSAGIGPVLVGSPADNLSNGNNHLFAVAQATGFDGTTWNRWRNNHAVTLYSSAARTGTPTVAAITNYNGGGFIIFVDVTTGAATPGVTASLQMVDSVGVTPKTIWTAAAAITSTSAAQFAYMFHPGHATAGTWTEALQMAMPRSMQLTMTHVDADSITYSVTVHFLAQ